MKTKPIKKSICLLLLMLFAIGCSTSSEGQPADAIQAVAVPTIDTLPSPVVEIIQTNVPETPTAEPIPTATQVEVVPTNVPEIVEDPAPTVPIVEPTNEPVAEVVSTDVPATEMPAPTVAVVVPTIEPATSLPEPTVAQVIPTTVPATVIPTNVPSPTDVPQVVNTAAQTGDCPTADFLSNLPATNANYAAPALNVSCDGTTVTVTSNGIPSFEFVQITPNELQEQTITYTFPQNPQVTGTMTDVPLVGISAVSVDGLPIFGPTEAPAQGSRDPYLDGILDFCNGHTAQRGDYHYHARPDCLFTDLNGNTSLVVAYALDGFPILAPFSCVDTGCTQTKKLASSWQVVDANASNAWEMHAYVAGSGDLDECNGTYLPDGSYAYYATDSFPYFMGCYQGTPSASNAGGGGGGGQGGGEQGQQPPPQGEGGGGQQGPPPEGEEGGQQGRPQGRPDFAAAAATLGITEQALRDALGGPPPDFAAAAETLGISEEALRDAMGAPQ